MNQKQNHAGVPWIFFISLIFVFLIFYGIHNTVQTEILSNKKPLAETYKVGETYQYILVFYQGDDEIRCYCRHWERGTNQLKVWDIFFPATRRFSGKDTLYLDLGKNIIMNNPDYKKF